MSFWHGLVVGVIVGIAATLFTSLLTELIVLAVLGGIVLYIGRKRWAKQPPNEPLDNTPSTTKTSL